MRGAIMRHVAKLGGGIRATLPRMNCAVSSQSTALASLQKIADREIGAISHCTIFSRAAPDRPFNTELPKALLYPGTNGILQGRGFSPDPASSPCTVVCGISCGLTSGTPGPFPRSSIEEERSQAPLEGRRERAWDATRQAQRPQGVVLMPQALSRLSLSSTSCPASRVMLLQAELPQVLCGSLPRRSPAGPWQPWAGPLKAELPQGVWRRALSSGRASTPAEWAEQQQDKKRRREVARRRAAFRRAQEPVAEEEAPVLQSQAPPDYHDASTSPGYSVVSCGASSGMLQGLGVSPFE